VVEPSRANQTGQNPDSFLSGDEEAGREDRQVYVVDQQYDQSPGNRAFQHGCTGGPALAQVAVQGDAVAEAGDHPEHADPGDEVQEQEQEELYQQRDLLRRAAATATGTVDVEYHGVKEDHHNDGTAAQAVQGY